MHHYPGNGHLLMFIRIKLPYCGIKVKGKRLSHHLAAAYISATRLSDELAGEGSSGLGATEARERGGVSGGGVYMICDPRQIPKYPRFDSDI